MTKNEQIKQTLKETHERRKTQTIKVFELKVNCHHTSKEIFEKLNDMFKQAKWVINDVIGSKENVFKYDYKEHRKVINFNKDGNEVEREITLPTVIHQSLVKSIQTDICNLSKAKKKGIKVGGLKFRSEVNRIPLRNDAIKIKSSKMIFIPSLKNITVYGLEQFINIPNFEIANANLIRKASGFYIKITVFIPKSNFNRKETNKSVGLDFGIKTAITTSDGEKFDCNKQETDKLKFLQKQLHKKTKGSKRYYKLLSQIRKEYEHISNQKDDVANKIVAHLLKENDVIYFQDEQISKWKKKKIRKQKSKQKKLAKKCGYSFGRQIQHSCLGRVKSKLNVLEKSGRSYKISKWIPTTKFCPKCCTLNTLTLKDRIYICDCGYSCDRDVHASKNVKLFGSTKRTECLEQASVETNTSTLSSVSRLALQALSVKQEKEATTL